MSGGAVAYLTQSNYGRNKTELTINNYYTTEIEEPYNVAITGLAADEVIADGTTELTNAYYTSKSNSSGQLLTGASNVEDTNSYLTLSNKYVTVYPWVSNSHSENYATYKGLLSSTYGFGDAMLETSNSGESVTGGWNSDNTFYFYDYAGPAMSRGSRYSREKNWNIQF